MKNYFLLFITMFSLVLFLAPTSGYSSQVLTEKQVQFTFFDLPDGEATLIRTGKGKSILINTGSIESEEQLLKQLQERNMKQINTLILTKQTSDYCGNATRVMDRYNIQQIIYTGELNGTCEIPEKKREKWKTGDLRELSEGLFFRVLHAENTGEMALGITYGDTSIMYLSNSDLKDEKYLLKYSLDPEILKIGDYGSGNSPSEKFLSKTDPHVSIMFHCKKCKTNVDLLERLEESWIEVYQLDRIGTTTLEITPHDYDIFLSKNLLKWDGD
ncbi:hypothetical protein NC797_09615 [Aquibacillus sp. 3ASR75-11]|uniref:Beta-lactamase superfamily II metal-dependent hydrolase n=1 Tax=Terrihalobacillus insolitus TaxID=2950438 RepID=A0A9X4ALZ9_9BACI|nr:hypothetical protein [Terrihalobacillus insolitus]MDC3424766.1 hypothetical protein [Terrihalobacillus insolitus]